MGEGFRVSESITLRLGPGHTPGHLIMDVRSNGESALFVGDILHHPAQVYCPDWNSPYCEDQPQARLTRRRVLEDAADRNALLIPAHFGGAHCCRVRRHGGASNLFSRPHERDLPLGARYRFDPADPDLIRHPYRPYYEYLRGAPGLHKAATEYFVASRYADVREVITNHAAFGQGSFVHNIQLYYGPDSTSWRTRRTAGSPKCS